nr:auxin-responsive protein IAA14-like [Tanacetum cinerariifolium]
MVARVPGSSPHFGVDIPNEDVFGFCFLFDYAIVRLPGIFGFTALHVAARKKGAEILFQEKAMEISLGLNGTSIYLIVDAKKATDLLNEIPRLHLYYPPRKADEKMGFERLIGPIRDSGVFGLRNSTGYCTPGGGCEPEMMRVDGKRGYSETVDLMLNLKQNDQPSSSNDLSDKKFRKSAKVNKDVIKPSAKVISPRRTKQTPLAVKVCICFKDHIDIVERIQYISSLESDMLRVEEEIHKEK